MPRRPHDDEYDDDRYDERPRRRRSEDDRPDDEYDDRPRSRRRGDDDRYDDRDRDRREQPSNGPATTAMVLGIISILGGITAIPGLICGFAGLSKAKKLGGAGKGMAVTGIILSGVGMLILGLTVWGVIWLFGAREQTRQRMIASNNLKQIGLGMHNYEGANSQFPSGVVRRPGDNPGRPIPPSELPTRLSWRVDLLPYIEQSNLYQMANPSEAWNSDPNRMLADTAIKQFADVDGGTDPKTTRLRVFVGEQAPFNPARGAFGPRITSILDGTSNTIMVAEAGDTVPWPQFNEIPFDPNRPPSPSSMGQANKNYFQVALFDGSVRTIKKSISQQTLKHAITPSGGEVIFDPDW